MTTMSTFQVIDHVARLWAGVDPTLSVEAARVELRKRLPDFAAQERAEERAGIVSWTQPQQAPMAKRGTAGEQIDAKARELLATPPWSTATPQDTSKMSLQHARIHIRQQHPDLAQRERDEERNPAAA
jgi:hypothetical protein